MLKLVVLSCVLAAAAASVLAPYAPLAYSVPLLTPYTYNNNYRGPLSLAPGQPADIIAADGRPLDTLDVNLDRAAHLTTKALAGGVHFLKKRSAPLIAPLSRVALTSPLIHGAPLAYSAPLYGSHFGHISYAAPISYTAPIAHYAWK